MRSTRSNTQVLYLVFRGLVDGDGCAGGHWVVALVVGQDALEIKLRSAFSEVR